MHRSIALFLILVFLPLATLAQQLIQGQVTDKKGVPIAFATIRLSNKGQGTHADAQGRFQLKALPADTLLITAVAYTPDTLPAAQPFIHVSLQEATLPLPEAMVTSKRIKGDVAQLGYFHNPQDGHFTGFKEAIVFIENPRKVPARIKEVLLMSSRVRFHHASDKRLKNHTVLFQLHLYARDPLGGEPTEDLLKNTSVHQLRPKQRKIRISLEDFSVLLPAEGVFLGISFIGLYREGTFVSFEQTLKEERAQFCVAYSEGHDKSNSFVRKTFSSATKPVTLGKSPINFNLGLKVVY